MKFDPRGNRKIEGEDDKRIGKSQLPLSGPKRSFLKNQNIFRLSCPFSDFGNFWWVGIHLSQNSFSKSHF